MRVLAMLMKTNLLVGLTCVPLLAATPASADDCSAVTNAFVVQQRTPWHMSFGDREMIRVNDSVYMRRDTSWVKLPPGNAVAAATAGSPAGTTYSDCKVVGRETIDGVPTVTYAYKAVIKGVWSDSQVAKVWIGSSDGLPYKWEQDGKVQTFTYKDVREPAR